MCVCYITLYTSVLVQFILAVAGAFNMYNTIVMSVTDNSVLSVHCTTYYTRLHIPIPRFYHSFTSHHMEDLAFVDIMITMGGNTIYGQPVQ